MSKRSRRNEKGDVPGLDSEGISSSPPPQTGSGNRVVSQIGWACGAIAAVICGCVYGIDFETKGRIPLGDQIGIAEHDNLVAKLGPMRGAASKKVSRVGCHSRRSSKLDCENHQNDGDFVFVSLDERAHLDKDRFKRGGIVFFSLLFGFVVFAALLYLTYSLVGRK